MLFAGHSCLCRMFDSDIELFFSLFIPYAIPHGAGATFEPPTAMKLATYSLAVKKKSERLP